MCQETFLEAFLLPCCKCQIETGPPPFVSSQIYWIPWLQNERNITKQYRIWHTKFQPAKKQDEARHPKVYSGDRGHQKWSASFSSFPHREQQWHTLVTFGILANTTVSAAPPCLCQRLAGPRKKGCQKYTFPRSSSIEGKNWIEEYRGKWGPGKEVLSRSGHLPEGVHDCAQ